MDRICSIRIEREREDCRRRQIYDDLAEEIRQRLAEKVEALMAKGMSRKDAEHATRREFGNVARIEEAGHEPSMWPHC